MLKIYTMQRYFLYLSDLHIVFLRNSIRHGQPIHRATFLAKQST